MDSPVAPALPQGILTVGHSTLPYGQFLALLAGAGVTAVADVRTAPYSRHLPHFNREALRDGLRLDGIAYVFLGQELGDRPRDGRFLCDGVADYDRMAGAPEFKEGIARVVQGASRHRIALMCSEHYPLDCHRCLLVGRALARVGMPVSHIMPGGRQASHSGIEDELLLLSGKAGEDLFASRGERLASAYRERARKVAYSADQDSRAARAGAG